MPTTTINVRTDSETKRQAQRIFESLGLDMTTAVNIFLRQTVRQRDIPFVLTTQTGTAGKNPMRAKLASESTKDEETVTSRGTPSLGCAKGRMWVAPDFDEPLEELREYRE